MFKIVFQSLLARKRRLFTTALAVIIGVAFTVGTLMLTDSMGKTFDDLSAGAYKNTDAVVRATKVFNDPAGDQRTLVDASLVPALSQVPGVAHAQGTVQGAALLIGKDGTPLSSGHAPTLGHLAVGDTTTVLAGGPPQRVRIAGIAGFGTSDNLAGASFVLFTTPVAQRLLAAP